MRFPPVVITRPGSRSGHPVELDWSRPYIMGVVNATPDSFSDGGAFLEPARALAQARALVASGADLIDVGGEATNPRAEPVDAKTELARVLPIIRALAGELSVPISIDTTKAEVARAAVDAGADLINDISGGLFDPAMAEVAAASGAIYILGHLRGRSLAEVFGAETAPSPGEVAADLAARLIALPPELRARTWIDPGLGSGKGAGEGNETLIAAAGELSATLTSPIVLGPSRKRFLARRIGRDEVAALDAATVGACLAGVRAGAHVLRVHNVGLLRHALLVYSAIEGE